MFTLVISKKFCRDHWTIKKVVRNITNLKTQSKGKGFKNLLPQDECKLKQVLAKQPFLTSTQIFKKSGIEGIEKDKRCRIFCDLGSVKKK